VPKLKNSTTFPIKMKKTLLTIFLFLLSNQAQAKLSIFACEPEWGSLARAIVKDKMDIDVATNSSQNPKFVDVKAVLVAPARRAKMIFCSGGGLEEKWLNSLIHRSTNLAAISDENSLLFAYDYAEKPKNIPAKFKYLQSSARVHLNPNNLIKIANEFTRRIKIIDPLHAQFYQENNEDFVKKMEKAIVAWEQKAAPIKGMPLLANDNSWVYLADWLGLDISTLYNPETGKKPDVLRLHEIVVELKSNPVEAIIFAGWEDKKSMFWIRDTAKVRVLLVPFSTKGPTDLFKMFDLIINALLTDCSSGTCKTLGKVVKTNVRFK
jgi:zinc/manganese transport system substrate-binding protein